MPEIFNTTRLLFKSNVSYCVQVYAITKSAPETPHEENFLKKYGTMITDLMENIKVEYGTMITDLMENFKVEYGTKSTDYERISLIYINLILESIRLDGAL